MNDTPPIVARQNRTIPARLREGTILSFTTVTHPPAGFDPAPRTIGLLELRDGSRVLGALAVPAGVKPAIGLRVSPRLRLMRVNDEGLRLYDVAYEVLAEVAKGAPRTTRGACAELRRSARVRDEAFPGYILTLSGPSGVGKTMVSLLLSTALSSSVARVPIITTRAPKEGDDGEYRYVSAKEFREMEKRSEIVAATSIPSKSENRRYGYRGTDIEAIWRTRKIPVVVTETHLLQNLATHYGRRSILSCGLLPPGTSKRAMLSKLLHRLRSRGRDTEEHIRERMRNAESDLQFFRDRRDLFDHLIVNEDLGAVVQSLKGHVLALQEA